MNPVSSKISRFLLSIISCALCILSLSMVIPVFAATVLNPQGLKPVKDQAAVTYVNATLTEDVSWRGNIVIKGYVAISPQTTLRIEPGTVIRFMVEKGSKQLPRLVVMGRIQCVGSVERPILFASNQPVSNKGDWGGILLLSSEKRNVFEHCRIEGAETGLEARFSTVIAKSLTITSSVVGCLLHDSIATLTNQNISSCDTGVEAHDSEVELRESTLDANFRGMLLYRSSVVMSSVAVTGSTRQAILSENCRLKLNACEVLDNALGAYFKGGEGQIFLSRFMRNHETALHVDSARLKISRCQISDNLRDGVRLEDDRATVWGNAIVNNGGYNVVYTGTDSVNVLQNWWGTSNEASIAAKLSTAAGARTSGARKSGALNVFPWLSEKPAIFQ